MTRSATRNDLAQSLALLSLFFLPLLPRPTSGGVEALAAPLFVAGLAYLTIIYSLVTGAHRWLTTSHMLVLGLSVLATTLYSVRVVALHEGAEITFAASRWALILAALSVSLLMATPRAFRRGLATYLIGFLVLATLAAFIGVTGFALFERPLPARTFGIPMPFFKTAGVPRSYGEQGIILSIALAFVLVYWKQMSTPRRWLLLGGCAVILGMGQSRNMMLAAAVLVATWFLAVRTRSWVLTRFALLGASLATFLVSQALPTLTELGFVRALVGEGIFERNVTVRGTLAYGAVRLLTENPWAAAFGWPHSAWAEINGLDTEAGVHNHFLSNLVFLGVIGGTLTIAAFYWIPLARILRTVETAELTSEQHDRRAFVLVAAAGVLTSLNFYEGFFSITLALFIGVSWWLMSETDLRQDGADPDSPRMTRARSRAAS
ncbi:hypothetical protein [Serinicoccus hydrothermalis]|uniref:hypothetical protein n=1 Tax=Serinicoccus hydrothermalis TaxID=1758689 RepID=UPI0008375D9D|nr:hypothetical protein [Serinicoccus hydrothermalis]